MKYLKQLKNRKGKDIIITTSWDDFSEYDEKLFELLNEHKIPATFYIPYKEITKPKSLVLAKKILKDYEIGSHTVNHPQDLKKVSDTELCDEVAGSKQLLEDILGTEITSFCYPRGRYNKTVINGVKEAGYLRARTTKVGNISIDCNPYEIKTTVHAYSGRTEYKGYSNWVDYALEKLDTVMTLGGYFHLWGHSLEVEKNGDWTNLSWFLNYLRSRIDELSQL